MNWSYSFGLFLIFITEAFGSAAPKLPQPTRSSTYNVDLTEATRVFDEKCPEAKLLPNLALCQEDWGRIYLFDSEIKTFNEARTWCRQKFESNRLADLIAVEDCPHWSEVTNILKRFYKDSSLKNQPSSFVWAQIVSGPEMSPTESSSEESATVPVMRAITSKFANEFLAKDESKCFTQHIAPIGDPKIGQVLTFRVNEAVITPTFKPMNTEDRGHALCQFRRPGEYIERSTTPEPKVDPSPLPATTAQETVAPTIVTDLPKVPSSTEANPEAVKVENYFFNIREEIKEKPEGPLNLTQKFLETLSSEEFVLSRSEHIHEVVSITRDLSKAFDEKINGTTDTKEVLTRRVKFTENLCKIYSEVLEDRNEESWQGFTRKEGIQVAQGILTETEEVGFKVACDIRDGNSYYIDAQDIQMEVFSFTNQKDLTKRLAFPTKALDQENTAQILFPSGVSPEAIALVSRCPHPSGLGSILKTLGRRMDPADNKSSIVSDLVAFSFGDSVGNLDVQVSLSHNQLKKRGDRVECVFWDTRSLSWNSSGCSLEPFQSTRGKSVCSCTHLTNFAILMDISGRQEDDPVKSILTLICLTASILSLVLTVFFLFTLPTLKSRRTTITANLCVCLLIVNFLIMFGVERTENPFVCKIISGLLFYSLAAAFSWMLLEGYFLYQMIIVVFKGAGYFRTRWFYLIGYGLALIWLTAAVSILGFDGLYEESSYYCWISNPLYPDRIWIFVGPVIVILALNMIIFVKSIRVARLSNLKKKNSIGRSSSAEQKTQAQLVRRWFKGWLSLMVLLGITWITGFLYIHESFEWFSYVFIVINSLQGVFIFLFEIVTNSKARPAIIKIVSGKFPSSYLSSLSKTSSSNPLSSLSSRNSRPLANNLSNEKTSSNGIFERKKFNNYDTMELT